jgi:sialate O-acetylesterase
MIVTLDVGRENTIHPPDKTTVAMRSANAVLNKVYGQKHIPYKSPVYKSMKIKGKSIVLSFKNASKGLVAADGKLDNFEIAGADKVFRPAEASILPDGKISVSNAEVLAPIAVRYGFKNWVKGDLYNKEGLPASSFRTDNW